MLDNALLALMIHGGCSKLSDITPRLVKSLVTEDLASLYKRMKVYSMIYTRNGPLHNRKKDGLEVYIKLMHHILDQHENKGNLTCEITGLKFERSFTEEYEDVIERYGFEGTIDKSMSRCWLPLAGSLGSEAQALPQARFTPQIAPIIVVIMQFLPLVATLYKGRVLLVDTADKDFALRYLKANYKEINSLIATKSKGDTIPNTKFTKGNYIQKALELLSDRQSYAPNIHLNLWSFTNAGTGAECEIDRIPDALLSKLKRLYTMEFRKELNAILTNTKLQNGFLQALEENKDFWGLYKTKHAEAASLSFYEEYQRCIGNEKKLEASKYIAKLLHELQDARQAKLFAKNDAHHDKDYPAFVFAVLIKASKQKLWSIRHHLEILDDVSSFPISSNFYTSLKFIHFYYMDEEVQEDCTLEGLSYQPADDIKDKEPLLKLLSLLQEIIAKDKKADAFKRDMLSGKDYRKLPLEAYVARSQLALPVTALVPIFFNEHYQKRTNGLLDLLRVLYATGENLTIEPAWPVESVQIYPLSNLGVLTAFCDDYISYKKLRGQGEDRILKEIHKEISMASYPEFAKWLRSNCEYMNKFEVRKDFKNEFYDYEFMTTDLTGANTFTLASFVIRYTLLKYFQ